MICKEFNWSIHYLILIKFLFTADNRTVDEWDEIV